MRRGMVVVGVAGLVGLAIVGPVAAQKEGTQFGEALSATVVRPNGAATPVVGIEAKPGGGVQVSGVKAQKLTRPIQAALAFLVRWGKGSMTVPTRAGMRQFDPATPVTILAKQVPASELQLVLPVRGLTRVADGVIRVDELGLKAGTADYRGPARLTYTTGADGWVTITGVVIGP